MHCNEELIEQLIKDYNKSSFTDDYLLDFLRSAVAGKDTLCHPDPIKLKCLVDESYPKQNNISTSIQWPWRKSTDIDPRFKALSQEIWKKTCDEYFEGYANTVYNLVQSLCQINPEDLYTLLIEGVLEKFQEVQVTTSSTFKRIDNSAEWFSEESQGDGLILTCDGTEKYLNNSFGTNSLDLMAFPIHLLLRIQGYLDYHSLSYAGFTCKLLASMFKLDSACDTKDHYEDIWRDRIIIQLKKAWIPILPSNELNSLTMTMIDKWANTTKYMRVNKLDSKYRCLYRNIPRVRTDGMYVSDCSFTCKIRQSGNLMCKDNAERKAFRDSPFKHVRLFRVLQFKPGTDEVLVLNTSMTRSEAISATRKYKLHGRIETTSVVPSVEEDGVVVGNWKWESIEEGILKITSFYRPGLQSDKELTIYRLQVDKTPATEVMTILSMELADGAVLPCKEEHSRPYSFSYDRKLSYLS